MPSGASPQQSPSKEESQHHQSTPEPMPAPERPASSAQSRRNKRSSVRMKAARLEQLMNASNNSPPSKPKAPNDDTKLSNQASPAQGHVDKKDPSTSTPLLSKNATGRRRNTSVRPPLPPAHLSGMPTHQLDSTSPPADATRIHGDGQQQSPSSKKETTATDDDDATSSRVTRSWSTTRRRRSAILPSQGQAPPVLHCQQNTQEHKNHATPNPSNQTIKKEESASTLLKSEEKTVQQQNHSETQNSSLNEESPPKKPKSPPKITPRKKKDLSQKHSTSNVHSDKEQQKEQKPAPSKSLQNQTAHSKSESSNTGKDATHEPTRDRMQHVNLKKPKRNKKRQRASPQVLGEIPETDSVQSPDGGDQAEASQESNNTKEALSAGKLSSTDTPSPQSISQTKPSQNTSGSSSNKQQKKPVHEKSHNLAQKKTANEKNSTNDSSKDSHSAKPASQNSVQHSLPSEKSSLKEKDKSPQYDSISSPGDDESQSRPSAPLPSALKSSPSPQPSSQNSSPSPKPSRRVSFAIGMNSAKKDQSAQRKRNATMAVVKKTENHQKNENASSKNNNASSKKEQNDPSLEGRKRSTTLNVSTLQTREQGTEQKESHSDSSPKESPTATSTNKKRRSFSLGFGSRKRSLSMVKGETISRDSSPAAQTEETTTTETDKSPSQQPANRSKKVPSGTCIFASWCWKEGGLRKTWKRRYFKITDEHITYGKSPHSVLSRIPLNIITTFTPFHHHASPLRYRDFGWRMTVKKGKNVREFFVVAESKDEARVWMHVLKCVVRGSWKQYIEDVVSEHGLIIADEEVRKDGKQKQPASSNDRRKSIMNPHIVLTPESVSQAVSDFRSKVVLKDRFVNFTLHKQCFTGNDAVSVTQEIFRTRTRYQAVSIANSLLTHFGIVESVNSTSGSSGNLEMHDEKNSLYRFTNKDVSITDDFINTIAKFTETTAVTSTNKRMSLDTVMQANFKVNIQEEPSVSSPSKKDENRIQVSETTTEERRTPPSKDTSSIKERSNSPNTPKSENVLNFTIPKKPAREHKKRTKSSVSHIAKALELFAESVMKLEYLFGTDATRIYTKEKREKKISGRYKVAVTQKSFIADNISESVRVEQLKLQKVKREKKRNQMVGDSDDILLRAQHYAYRESRIHERIYRIEKLKDQFDGLQERFHKIELLYEGQMKKQKESKLFELLRSERHVWSNIDYEEDEEENNKQQHAATAVAKIKVKGRRKPQAYYEEKEKRRRLRQQQKEEAAAKEQIEDDPPSDAHYGSSPSSQKSLSASPSQQQIMMTQKREKAISAESLKNAALLTDANSFTVESMKQIEFERVRRLQSLEADMNDLTELYRDLKHIVEDSQSNLNQIEKNVQSTNRNLERGVKQVRSARNNLGSSQVKKGLSRTGNILKWSTGF